MASAIAKLLGIEQTDLPLPRAGDDEDVNTPFLSKGSNNDIATQFRRLTRNSGTVWVGTFVLVLCSGLLLGWNFGHTEGEAQKRMRARSTVLHDHKRQNSDWSKISQIVDEVPGSRKAHTEGNQVHGSRKALADAQRASEAEFELNSQVDKVQEMEDAVKKITSLPTSPDHAAFLDPANPVRQYVKYKHDKSAASHGVDQHWHSKKSYPSEYDNPFANTRTGKQ
eukprot:CAMPEP_0181293272 /NCGR_PEP_ID=MMETSP1101-20121128/2977_1 /TAXON_ID=46948 /ORGANISM="Rhodomonas abbreviata, Strain Caron Lab Isolate" /LENGTH=223 /DNA_ID=CAMNT_0023397849 /DNA_START=79 /DNA_END=747 /DNA_ORIENTATION=+